MTYMSIQNEDQYHRYLKEVEYLIDLDPPANSTNGKRLSLIADILVEYNAIHFFFKTPTAIETIPYKMVERIANHQKRDYTHIIRA